MQIMEHVFRFCCIARFRFYSISTGMVFMKRYLSKCVGNIGLVKALSSESWVWVWRLDRRCIGRVIKEGIIRFLKVVA